MTSIEAERRVVIPNDLREALAFFDSSYPFRRLRDRGYDSVQFGVGSWLQPKDGKAWRTAALFILRRPDKRLPAILTVAQTERRDGSVAERVGIYPNILELDYKPDDGQAVEKACRKYKVELSPVRYDINTIIELL